MGFGGGQVRLGGVGEALGKKSSIMVLKTQSEARSPFPPNVWPQACP